MSKRRDNCDHDHLEVLPGNNLRCQRCGETIDAEELFGDHRGPVEISYAPTENNPGHLTIMPADRH